MRAVAFPALVVALCLAACSGGAPAGGAASSPASTPATPPSTEPGAASPPDATPAAQATAAEPSKLEAKKEPEKASEGSKPGNVGSAAVDEKPLGGRLTQDDIRHIVEKNGDLFNDCYTIGAGKGQQFAGKVTLKVTLGPTGNVNEAQVASSTTKNAKVDRCVVDGFKKIKFPTPKDGATTVFTFPMEFKGAVEVQQ